MRGRPLHILLAMMLGASGCGVVDRPTRPPAPEFDRFVFEVQPILATRCANPSCHGRSDRPLALYATQRNRMDEASTFLAQPLTAAELERNYDRVRGFLGDISTSEHSLLLKPLAVEAGGARHAAGAQFDSRDDVEYQTLHRWVLTAESLP